MDSLKDNDKEPKMLLESEIAILSLSNAIAVLRDAKLSVIETPSEREVVNKSPPATLSAMLMVSFIPCVAIADWAVLSAMLMVSFIPCVAIADWAVLSAMLMVSFIPCDIVTGDRKSVV